MNKRLLLLVVVLLTLATCALVVYGGPSERAFQGRLNPSAPSFDTLRRWFVARLKTSDLRVVSGGENCSLSPARLVIQEGGSCAFTIQADAGKTRQLSLVLGQDGASIGLKLTQPRAISVDQTLKAGQRIDLDVYKNDANQPASLVVLNCQVSRPENETDPDRLHVCSLEIKN